jgi:hypothetical protein
MATSFSGGRSQEVYSFVLACTYELEHFTSLGLKRDFNILFLPDIEHPLDFEKFILNFKTSYGDHTIILHDYSNIYDL